MEQFIGIEAGGTKFICAYGSGPHDLHEITTIPTSTPEDTLSQVINYIHRIQKSIDIKGIGLSSFGPIDLDKKSSTYGYITSAPKKEWQNCNIVGQINQPFNLPFGFDTDVNGAAFAEYLWGAAQGLSDFLYLTIGTGIGGGAMVNGELLHGAMHSEMGHIFIFQDLMADPFEGICPYHKNCLEGLASGPAIKQRWQIDSALELPTHHLGWDLEAFYLGQALANFTFVLSPKRIIIGGGVMRQNHLLSKIQSETLRWINRYVINPSLLDINYYITRPALVGNSGVLGGIALAKQAYLE